MEKEAEKYNRGIYGHTKEKSIFHNYVSHKSLQKEELYHIQNRLNTLKNFMHCIIKLTVRKVNVKSDNECLWEMLIE